MALQYLAHYGGYNMMDGGDWGWGLLMMFVWILLIVLVIVLVMRGSGAWQGGGKTSDNEALAVARKRYAKGEISKDEFEQLKKDLISK